MSTQYIKLVKGDLISTKGKHFRLAGLAKIKVTPDHQKRPIVGEHQSDVDPQRLKRIICQILEDKIKALEQKEMDALCSIEKDDVLFLFDDAEQVPETSFAQQINRTSTIVDLKQILTQIKAL